MKKKIDRPGVRAGYDEWSGSYDSTPNPLVALDRRHTPALLRPQPGEWILDAGCGTGAHLAAMLRARSRPVGLDLSRGMLDVARRKLPTVPLAQADLEAPLPVDRGCFHAALCALVGEHLARLPLLFREIFASLVRGGRLVFSVFHPEVAAGGVEANFERDGVEYRLGALRWAVGDYLDMIDGAGFRIGRVSELSVDEAIVREVPQAARYLGRPLLLSVEASRDGG